jgi:hypothetical protein
LVDPNEQYFVTESTNGSIARFIALNSAGAQVADYVDGFLSLGTTEASLRTIAQDGRLYACASKGNAHKCYIFSSLPVAGKLTAEYVLAGRDEIVPIGGNAAQIYDFQNSPTQPLRIRIPSYAPALSAWPTVGGP